MRNWRLAAIAGLQGDEPSSISPEGPAGAEGIGGTAGPGCGTGGIGRPGCGARGRRGLAFLKSRMQFDWVKIQQGLKTLRFQRCEFRV